MDSIREDESRERRREEALARRVGEALDRLDPHGAEPCPDAEIIAAFQEHALSAEETETCEKHFAACSRCRKILGVLAASVDAPLAETEVARLGELVAAAKPAREGSVQPAKTARPNRFDWRTRWLAPALGVAAVLAMWFAVRPPWRNPGQDTSGTLIAQAPKSEPAPIVENQSLDRLANAAPAEQRGANSAKSSKDLEENRLGSKAEALKPPEEALAKNRSEGGGVGGIAPRAGVAQDDLSRDKKSESAQTPTPAVGGTYTTASNTSTADGTSSGISSSGRCPGDARRPRRRNHPRRSMPQMLPREVWQHLPHGLRPQTNPRPRIVASRLLPRLLL